MRRRYNQFSHANNARYDSRLIALRSRHGWLGYGLYWALMELLNAADEAIIVADYCALSYELRADEGTLQSVIEDFDLFDFTESAAGDTLFSSNTLSEERAEARRISEIRAAAGRRGGAQRGNDNAARPDQKQANAKQMLSKCEANAKQMLSKCEANAKQMLIKNEQMLVSSASDSISSDCEDTEVNNIDNATKPDQKQANAKQMLSKNEQMLVSSVSDSISDDYKDTEVNNIDNGAKNVGAKNIYPTSLHDNIIQVNNQEEKEKTEKKEIYKERKEQREKVVVEKAPRFCPPTVDEVKAYILEKNYTVDAESFCDFYESKAWFVGKTKMRSWKAAVRTWQRRANRGAARTMAARSVTALDTSAAHYSETF